MLYSISLQELVPKNNFYRRLSSLIDFHWIYKQTASYYGSEGQESIDPVVFFKICMVGYINNIASDRRLIEFCSDSLAIRLFLGYDIDEPLPWHSTISRTRQLYGEKVFQQLFEAVFEKCVHSGMVAGHTQAIDGALLKANASKDSLEVKKVDSSIDEYLLEHIKANTEPRRPASINRAAEEQQHMQGDKEEQQKQLEELNTRYERQSKQYADMPKGDEEKAKFLSNKTHYSPTDPDARIAVKPGKPRELYYSGQIAVDTGNHVITHAQTVYAEGKDGDSLKLLVNKTKHRLEQHGLHLDNTLADAGYSSGSNYFFLEQQNINAYIPLLGGALIGSEGFVYDEKNDCYICPNNKILKGSGHIVDDGRGHPIRKYFSLKSDCDTCPLRSRCISTNAKTKKVQHSIYKPQLEAAKERAESVKGRRMKIKRSSTVEPVWGTLINFTGMKRINTRGISAANKCLILAATCYNLKKWMKHISKDTNAKLQALLREAVKGLNVPLNALSDLIEAPFRLSLVLVIF